jgi:transcriptional regulator with XRE-family HTH domain
MEIANTRPQQVVDIAKARTAAGVSKSELARRLGIPVRNVRRMENTDGYDPRFSRVVEIADALGVSTDALIPERAHAPNLHQVSAGTPDHPGAA